MFDMTSDHALSDAQMDRIEDVVAQLEGLNAAVRAAVEAGLSVELHRSERHHCGSGCWGDVMRPVIVKCM